MNYVYLIKSEKTNQLYIGLTNDLMRRLKEHNAGHSEYSRKFKPWKLVYFEGYLSDKDAKDREIKLKQFGKVYSQLKRRINDSINPEKVRG